jgi:threonine aldolase
MIDLRSDTVTKPTKDMLAYMVQAEVGDDVYGEDPSVNILQNKVAQLFNKEAALFMPSGTMSNQVALRTHSEPGDEVICDTNCHIFNYESGAAAALSGLQLFPVNGEKGILTLEQIEDLGRPFDHHFPQTKVVTLENTHNRAGGTIYPINEIKKIGKWTRQNDYGFHLDGARLMNASVATGISPKDYAEYFDSISLCFSKGLGTPAGSILIGSQSFIHRAHRNRKMFGGGMRQVGFLAAGAIYALDNHVKRLAEDHHRAKQLAETLDELGMLENEMKWTQTNIVMMKAPNGNADDIVVALFEAGLKVSLVNNHKIRLVTHLDFSDDDLERSIKILKKTMKDFN